MAAAKQATAQQAEPTEQVSDLDTIAPTEGTVTVEDVPCRVKRLRMRELMALVRVLTVGVGDQLGQMSWEPEDEQFGQQLLGMLLVGIPEAEDEACELIQKIVEPVDPRYAQQVREALDNPEADVLIDVISTVVEQERESFGLLLGKLRTLVGTASAVTRKTSRSSKKR